MPVDVEILERTLGAFGMQWLAGCALLERLEPEITEQLGQALAQEFREGQPLSFDERAAFYTLSWMRSAHIPVSERTQLAKVALPETKSITRNLKQSMFDFEAHATEDP